MAAPKGNKYYMKRGKDGREKKFSSPEKFLQKAYEYFHWCDENPWQKNETLKSGDRAGEIIKVPVQRPYSIEGLCVYVGISHDTFNRYLSDKGFCVVTTHVREVVESNQLEGAIVGAYNANIIARKLGLKEHTDHTTDGKPIEFNGFNFLPYTPEADENQS